MAQALHRLELCDPVHDAFGRNPGDAIQMMHDPALASLAQPLALETAQNTIAGIPAHILANDDRLSPAAQAMTTLECNTCVAAGKCLVNRTLHETNELWHENQEMAALARELDGAPWWVTMVRATAFPGGKERLPQLHSDKQAFQVARKSGELDDLLGEVIRCRELQPMAKDMVPELANIASVQPGKAFPTYALTTRSGNQLTVVDASVEFDPIIESDLVILFTKFIARLNATGSNGRAQIETADSIMQRPVLRKQDAVIFEIRMSGKGRLYFTVSGSKQRSPRITLIGYHGRDEGAQGPALKRIIGTAEWFRFV